MKRNIGKEKKIAQKRIADLFRQASQRPDMGNRYCHLAMTIAKKYTLSLTQEQKLLCCKKCHAFQKELRVRLARTRLIRHCLSCGDIWRIPYGREQKRKRTVSCR